MSDSEQLSKQLWKRANQLRRNVELYEEAVEHIGELESILEGRRNHISELASKLEQIAAVAHHGGLIGFADEHACLNEIRKLSFCWWDKVECSRLQREPKRT